MRRVTHQPQLMLKPAGHLTWMELLHQVSMVTKNLLDNVFMANNLRNSASSSSPVGAIDAGACLYLDQASTSGRYIRKTFWIMCLWLITFVLQHRRAHQ